MLCAALYKTIQSSTSNEAYSLFLPPLLGLSQSCLLIPFPTSCTTFPLGTEFWLTAEDKNFVIFLFGVKFIK